MTGICLRVKCKVLTCNIQNEMHYYIGPIQIYSGAEVSHTNRCLPKCRDTSAL